MYKDKIGEPGWGSCAGLPKGNGCECTSDNQCMKGSTCEILFTTQNCVPKKGAKIPRFIGVDQFGDYFDLYDLKLNQSLFPKNTDHIGKPLHGSHTPEQNLALDLQH